MKHIIGNIWYITHQEMINIEKSKIEYEIKVLGSPLLANSDKSINFWEKKNVELYGNNIHILNS